MKNVYKYEVPVDDVIVIKMPEGAEILHFEAQYGMPCIWARVDPDAPMEKRCFRFAGTGHPLGDNVGKHVGSCMMRGGALVWHLFELNDE